MTQHDDAAGYRRNAEKCVALAAQMTNAAQKLFILEMAQAWLKLAEKAGKIRGTRTTHATQDPAGQPSGPSQPG